ncbi:hypothetical protein [Leifsonia sp. TF02-11]|uniref:hypothetical protein n=1 Tax=Leifsonia sp. TF02-11 TaxID=2815212 RepID=UPI001AA1A95C|nr:hypothetical protein [Leifsonia sp. TF02-11]MBO1739568.1 hypothetical protein [Leifsonia sp. TF02-11]
MAVAANSGRAPTAKERQVLEARAARLSRPGIAAQVRAARDALDGTVPSGGLVLRYGYAFRAKPADADSSDRKAPPREQRPPATRLGTSRGAALRFHLMLLARVQANRKEGQPARLHRWGFTVKGAAGEPGWADLIVSEAIDTKGRDGYSTARDKRARSVWSALERLEEAGLVDRGSGHLGRNRVDDFVLLNECGTEAVGESEEYRVPVRGRDTFSLPSGFIEQGWVHVLEDSEIALLLMIACAKGALIDGRYVAVPGDVRLQHYGIHRDPFSKARKTLEWFGLLDVEEVGRHSDGRAEDSELLLNRFRLMTETFERPAVETMVDAMHAQLSRAW